MAIAGMDLIKEIGLGKLLSTIRLNVTKNVKILLIAQPFRSALLTDVVFTVVVLTLTEAHIQEIQSAMSCIQVHHSLFISINA